MLISAIKQLILVSEHVIRLLIDFFFLFNIKYINI